MDRYRLTVDKENFFSLFHDADAAHVAKLQTCTLKDVIITPDINHWEIKLTTDKDFDQQTLRAAEEFLRGKYRADVKIHGSPTNGTAPLLEKTSPVKKASPAPKKSAVTTSNQSVTTSNARSKKISGDVIKISGITENSGSVVIRGEVGSGDKNGVTLR